MKKILITICLIFVVGCFRTAGCFHTEYDTSESSISLWEIEEQERKKNQIEYLQECKRYVQDHSTDMIKLYVAGNLIHIGMNAIEVQASIGFPYEVNKTTGVWGVHEQWVYTHYSTLIYCTIHNDENIHKYDYLYFENGILTSWQN